MGAQVFRSRSSYWQVGYVFSQDWYIIRNFLWFMYRLIWKDIGRIRSIGPLKKLDWETRNKLWSITTARWKRSLRRLRCKVLFPSIDPRRKKLFWKSNLISYRSSVHRFVLTNFKHNSSIEFWTPLWRCKDDIFDIRNSYIKYDVSYLI